MLGEDKERDWRLECGRFSLYVLAAHVALLGEPAEELPVFHRMVLEMQNVIQNNSSILAVHQCSMGRSERHCGLTTFAETFKVQSTNLETRRVWLPHKVQ